MSRWGVFPCYLSGVMVQHVAPCDEKGKILPPHLPLTICPCEPTRDDQSPDLIIHHDRERGGHNA